ncbi:MAG: hypothetical protein WC300_04445 [Candidatus Omnitrophota bacterium]|jgi:hypothetical protein
MQIRFNIDPKKKSILISLVILSLAFFACLNIAGAQTRKRESIKKKVLDLSKKIVLRQDIEKIERIRQEYARFFHEDIDRQVLRSVILAVASELNVDIISAKPLERDVLGAVSRESIELSFRCSFNDLGLFISRIEGMPVITKIESLLIQGDSVNEGSGAAAAGLKGKIYESDYDVSATMVVAGYSING